MFVRSIAVAGWHERGLANHEQKVGKHIRRFKTLKPLLVRQSHSGWQIWKDAADDAADVTGQCKGSAVASVRGVSLTIIKVFAASIRG